MTFGYVEHQGLTPQAAAQDTPRKNSLYFPVFLFFYQSVVGLFCYFSIHALTQTPPLVLLIFFLFFFSKK